MNVESQAINYEFLENLKSRISISLLALRQNEKRCFLDRSLLNLNFELKTEISKLNELLSTLSSILRNKVIELSLQSDNNSNHKNEDAIQNLLYESVFSLKFRLNKNTEKGNSPDPSNLSPEQIRNIVSGVYSEVNSPSRERKSFFMRFEEVVRKTDEQIPLISSNKGFDSPQNYTSNSPIKTRFNLIPIPLKSTFYKESSLKQIKNTQIQMQNQFSQKVLVKPNNIEENKEFFQSVDNI